MANYTLTIQEIINHPLLTVFPENYPFYCDNEATRKEFEEKFIQHYLQREIGFETVYAFQQKLYARLLVKMPYYRQLYLTEWNRLRTIEEMMTSKNLKETTEHTQKIDGLNESNTQSSSSNNQSDTTNQSTTSSGTSGVTSSGTTSTTSTTNEKQSNLSDGVSQSSLTDGYLTSSGESTNTSNGETSDTSNTTISSRDTLESTSTSQGTGEQTGKITGSNKQELTESITFTSIGDIGVQTPAYAIEQWRNVLINIDEMIINDCKDLFMLIY